MSVRAACILVAVALLRPVVAGAQDAVWDPEEIARLSEQSAEMAEELSRAVELLGQLDRLSRDIGRLGGLSKLDFTHFDLTVGLQGMGPEIGTAGQAQMASFADAAKLVAEITSPPNGLPAATGVAQVQRVLNGLPKMAGQDGYALALMTRQSLSLAASRARLLVAEASSADDLRGDVAANTAVSLAVLEQLISIEAMLASRIEIEASGRLQPLRPSP